jgi:hypothetical protein
VNLIEKAMRYGLRRGWERGVLEGNRTWVVIGGAAVIAYLAETVFSELLQPGEAFRITHEDQR